MAGRSRLAMLGACVLAMASAVGGCGSSSSGSDSSSGDKPLIVVITPNPIGVDSFLTLTVDGVKSAADTAGADSKVYESSDPTSMSQNLEAAIALEPDVVVTVTFSFDDLVKDAAIANPDQQFVQIDSCPADAPENLTCAQFKEYEATYLAGVEAGLLTESNKVGAVAALDSPFIRRFSDPFGAGAQSVNPEAEFSARYVGGNNPFSDPARANAQAASLAEDGTDYVMASAAAGNQGVFQAAEENDFLSFGTNVNQCPDAPGFVVDNVVKKVDVAAENTVAAVLSGDTGGSTEYGLAEGGVTLTGLEPDVDESQCLIAEHPDVLDQVKEIRDEIVAGTLIVEDPAAQ
jgi:basic membrane protein A